MDKKLETALQSWDQQLVDLRNNFDLHAVKKEMMGKASEETVRSDFNNHEFKIGTLDRNLIRMAQDFETF